MDLGKKSKKFVLAYFSGTGCTKAVCDCFEQQLRKEEIDCIKVNVADQEQLDLGDADTLVIFSPVYAFRLASIMEKWIKSLPKVRNRSAVIISVSGGGEISPNTACRIPCRRLLEKKGYELQYEKMIIMPSNFAVQAEEKLNLELLTVLPDKINRTVLDILDEKKCVSVPKLQDRVFAVGGKAEHFGAGIFGACIRTTKDCSKCGFCVRNCPQKNIRMVKGRPKFGFHCMWCLKCIYQCPCKALTPGILKFSVLKEGFDLREMNRKAEEASVRSDHRQEKNLLWQGVIDYLSSDDC